MELYTIAAITILIAVVSFVIGWRLAKNADMDDSDDPTKPLLR